jgi:hypothetical protein
LKQEVIIRLLVGLEWLVRASAKVTPTMIARRIADDRRDNRREVRRDVELARLYQIDDGAEPLLDTVDRVLGRQAFVAGERGESAPLGLGNPRQPVEDIVFGMRWHGCSMDKVFDSHQITRRRRNGSLRRHLFRLTLLRQILAA